MKILCVVLILALTFITGHNSTASYRNHKVVSFKIENEDQLKQLKDLETEPGFTFLDSPEFVNMKLDLVIAPGLFPRFEEIAQETNIAYKVATEDLQALIDAERPKKTRKAFTLNEYNTLDEMYEFMDSMEQQYPDVATVFTIGESYEGRLIKGMRLTTNENNAGIFVEATIHSREWIASATTMWIINEILTTTDPEVKAIVDSVTWFFVPVLNVDGYDYTWNENRLWRKTRSIHNLLCRGVDPNRNFGWNWNGGGSSPVACTDTYMGPYAFSEPETKALMDFYATVADKMDLYLCFHSAAKMLMYPLGNTIDTALVPNVAHLRQIAEAAADALESVYGTKYQWGNAMQTLYVTSGSSRDHAYGHFKTPLVFTYEMREGPQNIFILPPDEIDPNSREIFVSLQKIITEGKTLGYFQPKG